MPVDMEKRPLNERFDHLLEVLSSQRFLKVEGIGNEVPFFICPYDVQEANAMEKLQNNLGKQLESRGKNLLRVNLYDLCIQILKERELWELIAEEEQDMDKNELLKNLNNVLGAEEYLAPKIAEMLHADRYDLMFLNGVGEVFPYIRSHEILNNLEKNAKTTPMVMFFPGSYTYSMESGASLDLFGSLHDDKYYRAFNIYHYQAK